MNKKELQARKIALEAELKQIEAELGKYELPKSWKELKNIRGYWVGTHSDIDWVGTNPDIASTESEASTSDSNRNIWPSHEEALASIALAQLCQLRDVYNTDEDGVVWKPNWIDEEEIKYIITCYRNDVGVTTCYGERRVLHFKSKKLRDAFMDAPEIRNLIEVAKPLL